MNLYKFGVLLTLYTGLRVGELCALNWEDVNDQYLVVSKTLHRIKDGDKTVLEITEPKTKASNRNIPLPPFLLPYIRQFKSLGYVMKIYKIVYVLIPFVYRSAAFKNAKRASKLFFTQPHLHSQNIKINVKGTLPARLSHRIR